MQELRKRGVDKETAAAATDSVMEELDLTVLDLARRAAEKKESAFFQSSGSQPAQGSDEDRKRREKLARFLAGRGFQSWVIRQVLWQDGD